MKTMVCTATAAAAMAILLSACGGSPTTTSTAGRAGPSYDGGFTMGSGNHEEPDSTTTSSDSVNRGGYIIGTGN